MFDIGMTELLLVGIVALIVIGPKDLPEMFRTLGRFTTKARGMAREFQRAMEHAADEAGVKDVAKDLRNATSGKSMGLDAVKDAATKFESWDPLKKKPPVAPPTAEAATPAPATPKGPATQALADAQAAKRVERAAKAEGAKPAARKRAPAKPAEPAAAPKKTATKKTAPEKTTGASTARKVPAAKKGDA
ncbi:MAG TPA: Sec-independent protein translocase protein TatB [Paracoccaceae bacterium]